MEWRLADADPRRLRFALDELECANVVGRARPYAPLQSLRHTFASAAACAAQVAGKRNACRVRLVAGAFSALLDLEGVLQRVVNAGVPGSQSDEARGRVAAWYEAMLPAASG